MQNMKKFLIIVVFTTFINSAFSQQWISLNPNPTGVGLSAVQMFSNNHGYMVGEAGTFLEYNGTDWEVVPSSPLAGSISTMYFLDENTGWVATEGGSIYHFDGTNWTKQFEDPSILFFSIHFSDANNGWAVGLNGAVVKFDGTNWTAQESLTDATLWTVYCWDASHVWAAGNQELYFYNGTEWTAVLEGAPCAFIDFHFNSLTDGIAYTNQALIYTYNGTTWTEVALNDGGFDDVEVLSPTDIWAVSDLGSIWHYDGSEWVAVEEEIVPNYGSFNGLDFSDPSHGWAVGSSGSIYQYDGTDWKRYTEGFSAWLNDMGYADENNVWLVGDESFIYYYNGSGWNQQTCPLNDMSVKSIDALSPDNVWAIAGDWDNSYMLHYDGATWSTHSNFAIGSIGGLTMINEDLGWACSGQGDILKYDGVNWSVFTSVTDAHFYKIGFASENDGWAGGYCEQKLYHFNGTAWSEYNLSGVNDDFQLQEMQFTSPTEGWAVGREKMSSTEAGYILHYDGIDWTVVLEIVESPFSGIEMINESLGWAVGDHTYKYNGTEWLPWSDNLSGGVGGVCFTDAETGWAYGEDGMFYKFNPDYVPVNIEKQIFEQLSITAFPNPTSNIISLTIPEIEDCQCYNSVKVYDMQGKLVISENKYVNEINVSELNSGLYVIIVEAKNQIYTTKFIKE